MCVRERDTVLDRLQPLLLGVFCVTVTALFSVWQLLPLLLLLVLKCPPKAPFALTVIVVFHLCSLTIKRQSPVAHSCRLELRQSHGGN